MNSAIQNATPEDLEICRKFFRDGQRAYLENNILYKKVKIVRPEPRFQTVRKYGPRWFLSDTSYIRYKF